MTNTCHCGGPIQDTGVVCSTCTLDAADPFTRAYVVGLWAQDDERDAA